MPEPTAVTRFAHVVGAFDFDTKTGRIDYVTPVGRAPAQGSINDENVHLVGRDAAGAQLFDETADVQRNSCAPHARRGTFEAMIPVSDALLRIELTVEGATAATFDRGQIAHPGAMHLSGLDPSAPHHLGLRPDAAVAPRAGVTYTLQGRPGGGGRWQTLAVGVPTPEVDVDVNQFPGSRSIDVRLLQSDGFSETEVFRETRTF
jgi:hypothetical protein